MRLTNLVPPYTKTYAKLPSSVSIAYYDDGFIVKKDKTITYYNDFENLTKATMPCIRKELYPSEACAGSC